jgi:hypothetical protein
VADLPVVVAFSLDILLKVKKPIAPISATPYMLVTGEASLQRIPNKSKVLDRRGYVYSGALQRMARNAAESHKKDLLQKFKIIVSKDAMLIQGLEITVLHKRGVTQNELDCCSGCLGNVHKTNNGLAECPFF